MFARFTTSFVAVSLLFASLAVASPEYGNCNSGQVVACCTQEIHSRAFPRQVGKVVGSVVDVDATRAVEKLFVGCTPVANLDSTCQSRAVCCNQQDFGPSASLVNTRFTCNDLL
ncbi:hypothetical protein NLI96_g7610 [Meripilus lineatus]|uniref:Hydrophobin n=1 Tax=Meripilus lineatus TaxID=2056292 RepID=A0AAD5YH28_9APHY|nr:hypothetical protein NLI96_g7610 [Physisporinus lineatus]